MVVTGELIRLLNYVDEVTATLRRISATIPVMTDDEKRRLAEHIRKSDPTIESLLARLDGTK